MIRAAALCALLAPLAAQAQAVEDAPFEVVAQTVRGRVDFGFLPDRPYPGYNFDQGFAFEGGKIGEHFAGQTVVPLPHDGDLFDDVKGAPTAPLSLRMGPPGQTLSLTLHRAFGKNALYPIGPLGQPDPKARGEGVVAFWFAQDICAFALRIHTEYTDALGSSAGHRGAVQLRFFARDGALIANRNKRLPEGISDLGFLREGGRADIAGVQVLNLDPGGISLNDIHFGCQALTG